MSKTPNHARSAMKCPVHLEDVDLFAPGAQEHWYEAYPILHAESPVHRIPGEGTSPETDGFILSRYEDIARVVRDPARFPPPRFERRADGDGDLAVQFRAANPMTVSIQSLRPNMELWRAHRLQLTDAWVGPGATRHSEMITEVADALIDGWIDQGEVEFISGFAAPLPQTVMTRVLGFPEADMPRLQRWSQAQVKRFVHGRGHRNLLTKEEEAEQVRVLAEFSEYVQTQLEHKRARPGDDMLSFLADVTYPALGRKLSDVEIVGIVYAMHLGGLETTQYAIAEQAQLLCDQPGVWRELVADPGKLRAFIEEAMRLRAPTQGLSTRMTTQNETFQGVAVPKGSILHMRWAAGNVDPEEYDCPFALQLDRKRIARHLTFSQGPRSCPGAGLSRLEQTIAWTRLLERIEHIEYADGNTFEHQPGIMLGTLSLRLRFEKKRS